MSNYIESSKDIIAAINEEIGLQKFNLELVRLPEYKYKLSLRGGIDFEIPNGAPNAFWKEIGEVMQPLLEDMRNSQLVKGMVEPLKNKIFELEKAKQHFEKLSTELAVYKTYYDLEYKLRHGEIKND